MLGRRERPAKSRHHPPTSLPPVFSGNQEHPKPSWLMRAPLGRSRNDCRAIILTTPPPILQPPHKTGTGPKHTHKDTHTRTRSHTTQRGAPPSPAGRLSTRASERKGEHGHPNYRGPNTLTREHTLTRHN